MAERRFYWLKLKEDFFDSKKMKKLRSVSGGDTFTIIYLKMLLRAVHTEGILKYEGVESDFAEELALDLNEKSDDVRITVNFLASVGLIEVADNDYLLPECVANIDSESASAKRVREFRERQALQCNTVVTEPKRIGNVDIDIEKDIDTEIDKDKKKRSAKRFTPPTLEEVTAYCKERQNNVDPQKWLDYYTSNGWMVGKNHMKDWKAAVRTWEKNNYGTPKRSQIVPDYMTEEQPKEKVKRW